MVLFALAHHANDDGFCFPGIELIAMEAGIHPRNVYRALDKLEQAELIRRRGPIKKGAVGGLANGTGEAGWQQGGIHNRKEDRI